MFYSKGADEIVLIAENIWGMIHKFVSTCTCSICSEDEYCNNYVLVKVLEMRQQLLPHIFLYQETENPHARNMQGMQEACKDQ